MFEAFLHRVRHYVSPAFVALLVASFVLWYIAKLNYTYTTNYEVSVNVDGRKFKVDCVIEGIGTHLFGHVAYFDKWLKIPLSELGYAVSHDEGSEGMLILDPKSLQNAISVRYSDVKIVSVGNIPPIEHPESGVEPTDAPLQNRK